MILMNNFSTMYNEGVAIYVQPPTRRMVKIEMLSAANDDDDDDEYDHPKNSYEGRFFLSFPYVVFRIHYRKIKNKFHAADLCVMFSTKPKANKLYYVPLLNIEEDGKVCMKIPSEGFKDEEEMCKEVIARFWSSKFEDSMYGSYSKYDDDSLLGDHRKWQAKTKKEPKWVPNGHSLKQADESELEYDDFLGKQYTRLSEENDE